MIGRGDVTGIDLVALGREHLAPIRVALCSRELLESPVGAGFIDITEGINRLARRGAAIEIAAGPATRTNEGEIQLAVGGGALPLHEAGEKVQRSGGSERRAEETAAGGGGGKVVLHEMDSLTRDRQPRQSRIHGAIVKTSEGSFGECVSPLAKLGNLS